MTDGLTFTLPTGREELVAAFLSVSDGAQQLMFMAIKLHSGQPGGELADRMLMMLRTDPRTRRRVRRVEGRLQKNKIFREEIERQSLRK
ncbi:hypothetical protein DESA109040_18520 [Deinococcus saxicola]|uniref:hypothetical protein n=1 Tax=Deinococcus saxicola TaxID=249406 RepID=UPI0039F0D91A